MARHLSIVQTRRPPSQTWNRRHRDPISPVGVVCGLLLLPGVLAVVGLALLTAAILPERRP